MRNAVDFDLENERRYKETVENANSFLVNFRAKVKENCDRLI